MNTSRVACLVALLALVTAPAVQGAETYEYDAAGRLSRVTLDSGTTITYQHDLGGNLVSRVVSAPDDEGVGPAAPSPAGVDGAVVAADGEDPEEMEAPAAKPTEAEPPGSPDATREGLRR